MNVQTCKQCGKQLDDHALVFDENGFASAGSYNPAGDFTMCGSPDTQHDPLNSRVETIGPFNTGDYYLISCGGYKVPYLQAWLMAGTEDRWVIAVMDGDRSVMMVEDVVDTEFKKLVPIIANGMALAAGYTSFGGGAKPRNPFMLKLTGL